MLAMQCGAVVVMDEVGPMPICRHLRAATAAGGYCLISMSVLK